MRQALITFSTRVQAPSGEWQPTEMTTTGYLDEDCESGRFVIWDGLNCDRKGLSIPRESVTRITYGS